MASSRHLYYCLAFRNAKHHSWNEYQLFNSCFISNCSNCSSLQYYFRQKAFRLKDQSKIRKAGQYHPAFFILKAQVAIEISIKVSNPAFISLKFFLFISPFKLKPKTNTK